MSKSLLSLQDKRTESFFVTTYRNLVAYWSIYFFVMPIALSMMFQLIDLTLISEPEPVLEISWSIDNSTNSTNLTNNTSFVSMNEDVFSIHVFPNFTVNFSSTYSTIDDNQQNLFDALIKSSLWIVFSLHIFLGFSGQYYWRLGVRDRHWLIISSMFVLVLLFFPQIIFNPSTIFTTTPSSAGGVLNDFLLIETPVSQVTIFISVWVIETIVIIVLSRFITNIFQRGIILISLVSLIILTIYFPSSPTPWLTSINVFSNFLWLVNAFILTGYLILYVPFSILRTLHNFGKQSHKKKWEIWWGWVGFVLSLRFIFWVILGITILYIQANFLNSQTIDYNNFPQSRGTLFNREIGLIIALLMQLLAFSPQRYWHSAINRFRSLWLPIRKDRIYDISSPRIAPTNFFNYLWRRWMPKYLRFSNRYLILTLCLVVGLVIVPLSIPIDADNPNFASRFGLSIAITISLIVLYMSIWLIMNRSRYVISKFEVSSVDEKDQSKKAELEAIANLITHLIVEELQQISILITTRQVENVNLSGSDSSAFFVTAGYSQEFINEMQDVVNVETANGNVKIGSFAQFTNYITRFLARIRIEGKLMARDNGSIDVWAELNYTGSQSVAVNITINPEAHLSEFNQQALKPYIRNLALSLILELGQLTHIGSRLDGLNNFLLGLEASVKKNWWEAEYYYRQATRIEETYNDYFGVGHYHLGASLIFQGNWREGMKHLRKSEKDGPQMAETQYMLALTLLHSYWTTLHKYPAIFNEIEQHCRLAIDLRNDFPETFQLWGMLYYRLARLIERTTTNNYDSTYEMPAFYKKHDYKWYYAEALKFLHKAIHLFDKQKARVPQSPNYFNQSSMETNTSLQQRMSIAHSIGDTFRGLRLFSTAETYYRDVQAAFPRDRQNLTDLAQLYFVGKNWQQGEQYLWREVFSYPLLQWDPHPNMYMGAIILGGINDGKLSLLRGAFDLGIGKIFQQVPNSYASNNKDFQHSKAIGYLDYAILMRPRFISFWGNTNWVKNYFRVWLRRDLPDYKWPFFRFEEAQRNVTLLQQKKVHSSTESMIFYQSDNDTIKARVENEFNYEPKAGAQWFNYRIYSLMTDPQLRKYNLLPRDIKRFIHLNEDILSIVNALRQNRQAGIEFHRAIDKQDYPTLESIENHDALVQMTKSIFSGSSSKIQAVKSLHQEMLREIEANLAQQHNYFTRTITLQHRIIADLHNESLLRLCQLMAETHDFQSLKKLLDDSIKDVFNWEESWRVASEINNEYFTFSPKVGEFQRASLYAWHALACYIVQKDVQNSSDDLKITIRESINNALSRVPTHPIALLVDAWFLRDHKEHERAIDIYYRILDATTPYLPQLSTDFRHEQPPERGSDSQREEFYYTERIAGWSQFHGFTSMWQIHAEMADTFYELKQVDESTYHWAEAVRWSPYVDVDLKLLIRLSEVLVDAEKYQQALATARSANHLSTYLDANYPITLHIRARLLETVALSRTNNHSASIITALENLSTLKGHMKSIALPSKLPDNHVSENCIAMAAFELSQIFDILKLSETETMKKEPTDSWEIEDYCSIIEEMYIKFKKEALSDKREKYFLAEQDLQSVFAPSLKVSHHISFDAIYGKFGLFSHRLTRLPKNKSEKLVYDAVICVLGICDMLNLIVYGRIEKRTPNKFNLLDALLAIALIQLLYHQAGGSKNLYNPYRYRVAQYLDTLAWLVYVHRKDLDVFGVDKEFFTEEIDESSLLNISKELMLQALRYNPNKAVIEYHIVHILTSQIDIVWQTSETKQDAMNISENYLDEAYHRLKNAQNLDTANWLSSPIAKMYKTLNTYQIKLHEAKEQMMSFDNKKDEKKE